MSTDSAMRFGGRHAVVIGGSLGGLVAARVLSDHFDQVTVLERDALPDSDEPRKGVPQGRQLHGLLKRGELLLSEWFPGLIDSLVAGGATHIDFGSDVAWYHFGAWKVHFESEVRALSLSRPFLEGGVRRCVRALSNVRFLDEYDVDGFATDEAKARVTGVIATRRNGGSARETIGADLVVDASGRGSQTPAWLRAMGRGAVDESFVKVKVGYSSRLYRRPPAGTVPWKALYVLGHAPQSKRLGAIFPIEGDRWIALLGGLLDEHPPSDTDGWLDFARLLDAPDFHSAVSSAEPISDIMSYKFPAHQRRHYERMKDFPDGLAVLGDAACSFNPIYGQGMTTAALGAQALGGCLRDRARLRQKNVDGLSRSVQAAVARIANDPWTMSTGEDFRYAEVEGTRPFGNGAMQWFTGKVHRAAATDRVVSLHFIRAMHMIEPPTALMTPSMIWRVLSA